MERFVMIEAMSINQDSFYKEEDGFITTTKDINEAIVVDSIEEGLDLMRYKVLYAPIFQPI